MLVGAFGGGLGSARCDREFPRPSNVSNVPGRHAIRLQLLDHDRASLQRVFLRAVTAANLLTSYPANGPRHAGLQRSAAGNLAGSIGRVASVPSYRYSPQPSLSTFVAVRKFAHQTDSYQKRIWQERRQWNPQQKLERLPIRIERTALGFVACRDLARQCAPGAPAGAGRATYQPSCRAAVQDRTGSEHVRLYREDALNDNGRRAASPPVKQRTRGVMIAWPRWRRCCCLLGSDPSLYRPF
jgi:hypothetical protein